MLDLMLSLTDYLTSYIPTSHVTKVVRINYIKSNSAPVTLGCGCEGGFGFSIPINKLLDSTLM